MKRVLTILVFSILLLSVRAQDPQFSQFYAAPSYLNPAFVGTGIQHRFILNHRHQWPSIPGAFVSSNISYDNNFSELNSGLGVNFTHDRAGTGGLTFTRLALQYAYEIKLNRTTFLRPAIEYASTWRYIDRSKLIFGDQLVRGGSFSTLEFVEDDRINFFDLSSGILLYTPEFWGGIAIHHMNQPSQSLLGNDNTGIMPVKYSAHAGWRIPLKDFFGQHLNNFLIPAFNYKAQGKYDQFDVGLYFERNPMTIGVWYRGIPGFKAYEPGYANDDAIILLMGVKAKKFKIGYSYDITISRLVSNTGGSHEISLTFEYANIEETLSRSSRNIACPKF